MTFTEGWRASCLKAVLDKYLKACCALVLERSSASPSGCNMIWPTSYRIKDTNRRSPQERLALAVRSTRTREEVESCWSNRTVACNQIPMSLEFASCTNLQARLAWLRTGPHMPSSSRGQRAARSSRPPRAHCAPDTYCGVCLLETIGRLSWGMWLAREQPVDTSILLTATKRLFIHEAVSGLRDFVCRSIWTNHAVNSSPCNHKISTLSRGWSGYRSPW